MTTKQHKELVAVLALLVAIAIGSWTLAIITAAYFLKAYHE